MRLQFKPLVLMLVGVWIVAPVSIRAQGSTSALIRHEVSGDSTHLIMNGAVTKSDEQETDFRVCDVDLDGDWDVIVGRKTPFTLGGPGYSNLLLLNDSSGRFEDVTASFTDWNNDARNTAEVKTADMNNDGWPDVVFFNTFNEPTVIYLNLGNDSIGVWNGFSAAAAAVGSASGPVNAWAGELFDYDLDGLVDIYRANTNLLASQAAGDSLLRHDPANLLSFVLANSTIPPVTGVNFTEIQTFGTRVQAALDDGTMLDLNGDGNVDLMVTGAGRSLAAYSDGLGGFLGWQFLEASGCNVYDSNAGDFDNDGKVDVLRVTDGFDFVAYNTGNDPNGLITESFPNGFLDSNGIGSNPVVVDFDSDGDLDILVAPVDAQIWSCSLGAPAKLFINTGVALNRFVLSSAIGLDLAVYDFAVRDFDGDSLPDILYSGCNGVGYKLWLSDPNAASPAFQADFVPNGAGLDFRVRNIPVNSGNFRALYNFVSLDLSQAIGSGPFLGMPNDVIGQASAGPPFSNVLSPGQDNWAYFIPPAVTALGLDVRTLSVAVDPGLGTIDLSVISDSFSDL